MSVVVPNNSAISVASTKPQSDNQTDLQHKLECLPYIFVVADWLLCCVATLSIVRGKALALIPIQAVVFHSGDSTE